MAAGPSQAHASPVIRVALVDDHHAVRLGLTAALAAEPDMEPVGAATCAAEVPGVVERTAPDVVVLDYRLPDGDGLTICAGIKRRARAPGVVLHSAFADDELALCALVAGADAVVSKGSPGGELAAAVRAVAAGERRPPAVAREVVRAGAEAVEPLDVPVLSLLVHGAAPAEVAGQFGLSPEQLRMRQDRMLAALRGPVSGRSVDRAGTLGSTPHGTPRVQTPT